MLLRLHHLNNLAAIAGAAWLAIFIAVISTLCPVAANDVPPSAAVRARSGERDMVWIPGGSFKMGCADESFGDTRPIHEVHLSGFWLDRTPVTNEQFAEFVAATGYVTAAERKPDPKDFPGAPPEDLVPGSLVFSPPPKPVSLNHPHQWWRYVPGASWKHPQGPASSIQDKLRHPVVHVAFEDAVAYAKWAGKRLPTEAEFEYAARGGLDGKLYPWGDELRPGGKWYANLWQGEFPVHNSAEDGFAGTSPVGYYRANGYGLYDMAGNVWQWCSDWYRDDYYRSLAGNAFIRDPQGPDTSFDPLEPGQKKRVLRGGSHLCTDQYCARYIVGSRGKAEVTSSSSNIGFRCARDDAVR